jgi:hypothetical protein
MAEPEPAEILLGAVNSLPKDDHDKVVLWMLERSFGRPPFVGGAPRHMVEEIKASNRRGDYQVVPIRLPADQHAALRDWCAEHNFSMATVVRGLVERFLEERGGGAGVAPPAQD